jgi:hypothetical protein
VQFHAVIPLLMLLVWSCGRDEHHAPVGGAGETPAQSNAGAAAIGGGTAGMDQMLVAPPAPAPPPPRYDCLVFVSCPTPGVEIKADLQITFEQAKHATFTLCRSNVCLEWRLPEDAMRRGPFGPSVQGLLTESSGAYVQPALVSDGPYDLHFELTWDPPRGFESDRYRVSVTRDDGHSRRLVDQEVKYFMTGVNCDAACIGANPVDVRGQPPLDPLDDSDGGI